MSFIFKLYNNFRSVNKIKREIILNDKKILITNPIKVKPIYESDTIEFVFKINEEGQVIGILNNYNFYISIKVPYDDINIFKFIVKFNNIHFPDRYGSFDERSISKIAKFGIYN